MPGVNLGVEPQSSPNRKRNLGTWHSPGVARSLPAPAALPPALVLSPPQDETRPSAGDPASLRRPDLSLQLKQNGLPVGVTPAKPSVSLTQAETWGVTSPPLPSHLKPTGQSNLCVQRDLHHLPGQPGPRLQHGGAQTGPLATRRY